MGSLKTRISIQTARSGVFWRQSAAMDRPDLQELLRDRVRPGALEIKMAIFLKCLDKLSLILYNFHERCDGAFYGRQLFPEPAAISLRQVHERK